MTVYVDAAILPNLTVWQNAKALERFVFKTLHSRFYGRREEWFTKIEVPLVMWWVSEGHRPDLAEGVARRDHLLSNGPSDFAFGWESLASAQLWKTARCDAPRERAA
jgi:hypothetical protein